MRIVARPAIALLLSGLLFAAQPPGAVAAPGSSVLGGQITLTGTDGKDEFVVEVDQALGSQFTLTVTPAVTVTAASGSCPPETDPITGRPTVNICTFTPSGSSVLVIDLRAGDDKVEVDDPMAFPTARANGGAGNDQIVMDMRLTSRTLNGDDGNDVLAAPGLLSANPAGNRPTTYNGGTGIDTADLRGIVSTAGPIPEQIGVSASLVRGSAVYAGRSGGAPTTFRTDVLNTIETLSGTDVGDVLTGAASADVLLGGDGNDNLVGGDGADNLQGGAGLDNLDGGKDADSLDGGLGIDLFPAGAGGDTFLTRDGFAETVPCTRGDLIVDDLADRVTGSVAACSISTAAAKHRYDTKLSGRPAQIADGALETRVRCPARKSTTCAGHVEALLGKRTLGEAHYRVRPGNKTTVRLPLSKADARRAAGRKILLSATELDADGRDRFVSRPTRVSKTSGPRSVGRPR